MGRRDKVRRQGFWPCGHPTRENYCAFGRVEAVDEVPLSDFVQLWYGHANVSHVEVCSPPISISSNAKMDKTI
jgi:hypothetical protein